MSDGRSRIIGAGLAVAGVALAASLLRAREQTVPLPESMERLMYLQSDAVATRAYLSFDALAADVYWIRTIQHYGRDRKSARTSGRFEFLAPLLNLTTTLDPRFNVAYRFGALFLASEPPEGPGRPDQAVQLLEKGLRANGNRWQYAHDIGFVHYWYTGDYEAAATWFERAASLPGAPDWIRPLAALTRAQGGDRQGASRLLSELLTSDQNYIRAAAERGLAQLSALDAIDQLQAMVDRYRAALGVAPGGWMDLVRARVLAGIPADPTGEPFVYDQSTGTVGLSPQSKLSPLPKGLLRT